MNAKTCLPILLLIFAICSGTIGEPAIAQTPTKQTKSGSLPKIHLVIIGVPTFSIEKYKKNLLGADIERACGEILQFFKDRFPADQLVIHPDADNPCTTQATTYASIRRLLYVDLPSFGKGTLTFVFMMSHGEAVNYSDNKLLERDLRFITSDTTEADRDEKSLSIGIEVLPWLEKVPPGSTVLYFVDTCTAAAADTLKLALEKGMLDFQGLKTGLIVSSLAGQTAYSASFTRALLQIWKEKECPKGKFEQALRNQTATLVRKDLANFEGDSKVLIPYSGGWCFNELGASGKLLFLYQGNTEDVLWTMTRIEKPAEFTPRTRKTYGDSFDLEILPPGHYNVTAESPNQPVKSFGPIDLETLSTAPVFFTVPNNPTEVQAAVRAWADRAKFKGIPESDATALEGAVMLASATAYGTENDTTADQLFAEILSTTQGDHRGLAKLGERLLRGGQLDYASKALKQAAKVATDPKIAAETAKEAYYSAAAAGNVKDAIDIRNGFHLEFGADDSLIRGAEIAAVGPPEGGGDGQLRALSAVSLLTRQSHWITDDLSAEFKNEGKLVALETPNRTRLVALAAERETKPPAFETPTDKWLVAFETSVKNELNTRAEELRSIDQKVTAVSADLSATKEEVKMARSEMGTLIARNHDEIDQLRRLGERDYVEFTIKTGQGPQRVGPVQLELLGVNLRDGEFTVRIVAGSSESVKKNRSIQEPIVFYPLGYRQPFELVVNKVSENNISGYISVPKNAIRPAIR